MIAPFWKTYKVYLQMDRAAPTLKTVEETFQQNITEALGGVFTIGNHKNLTGPQKYFQGFDAVVSKTFKQKRHLVVAAGFGHSLGLSSYEPVVVVSQWCAECSERVTHTQTTPGY